MLNISGQLQVSLKPQSSKLKVICVLLFPAIWSANEMTSQAVGHNTVNRRNVRHHIVLHICDRNELTRTAAHTDHRKRDTAIEEAITLSSTGEMMDLSEEATSLPFLTIHQ